jgi:hypothetical protein
VASFHNNITRRLDSERVIAITEDVVDELVSAANAFASMHSAHEGYATILEELDELWEEIKAKIINGDDMRKEAIQVAAMGIRFVHDVCDA